MKSYKVIYILTLSLVALSKDNDDLAFVAVSKMGNFNHRFEFCRSEYKIEQFTSTK